MAEINPNQLGPATNLPALNPEQAQAIESVLPKNQEPDTKAKPAQNQASKIAGLSRATVHIGELATSLPLLFSSFVNQADNIAKQGGKYSDHGFLSFISSSLSVVSYPFRKILHRWTERNPSLFTQSTELPDEDVEANRRSFLLDDVHKRTFHHNVSKQFTSLIFNFRRIIFNIFPKVFTVPSEAHDPDNPQGRPSSKILAKLVGAGSSLLSPFRFASTALGIVTTLPSYLGGTVTAYTGNQKLYNIANYFSKIADLFTPIYSNLSSLLSTTRALYDSALKGKGEPLKIAFGRYNIGLLNSIQGVVGSILSVPHFFGAFAKSGEIIFARDDNSKLILENHIRDIVGEVGPLLKSLNLYSGMTIGDMQEKAASIAEKTFTEFRRHRIKITESLFNATPWLQKFFSTFRPVDYTGRVVLGTNPGLTGASSVKGNTVFGVFNKDTLFEELFDLLHPIQSLLMTLPNAFTAISDPYVADNAKPLVSAIDRFMGFNSMIFSFPNYIIYALTTRVPQILIKALEMKEKYMKSNGHYEYDAYHDYAKLKRWIKHSSVPGTGYLRAVLDELDVDRNTFMHPEETRNIIEQIEEEARQQEPSVKASELVHAMRIGLRTILKIESESKNKNKRTFLYAERDEQGYTVQEVNRRKIYDSLGTLSEGVRKFPVVGWLASPFVNMFRRLYYVKPKEHVKRFAQDDLPIMPELPAQIAA